MKQGDSWGASRTFAYLDRVCSPRAFPALARLTPGPLGGRRDGGVGESGLLRERVGAVMTKVFPDSLPRTRPTRGCGAVSLLELGGDGGDSGASDAVARARRSPTRGPTRLDLARQRRDARADCCPSRSGALRRSDDRRRRLVPRGLPLRLRAIRPRLAGRRARRPSGRRLGSSRRTALTTDRAPIAPPPVDGGQRVRRAVVLIGGRDAGRRTAVHFRFAQRPLTARNAAVAGREGSDEVCSRCCRSSR